MLLAQLGYDPPMRSIFLPALLALSGCYASHTLSDRDEGIACGDDACPLGTACVHCPGDTPGGGGPRCDVMPDGAPDFWTWAYECSPSFAPHREVEAFLCDGPEDCDRPERCLRDYPGTRCDVPCVDCGVVPEIVCHEDANCDAGSECRPSEPFGICR